MNVENLNLSPEQQQTLAAGGHLEMWDDPKSGKKIPMVIEKPQPSDRQSQKKYKWTRYEYQEQLELAKLTRNALLAVLAELHRLHFLAWDKKAPINLAIPYFALWASIITTRFDLFKLWKEPAGSRFNGINANLPGSQSCEDCLMAFNSQSHG